MTIEGRQVIHLQWGAVLKQLRRSETGVPVLRLLVSGTKLDRASYQYGDVDVVGEKVSPELLATMWNEAKAGTVYLLENHQATIPFGWSADADLQDCGDGINQELYVDFMLDLEQPVAQGFIKLLQAKPEYEPDCSVGLMVRRVIEWDDLENGYVGKLVEGHFEHVALTRPDHNAYPDADIEEVFLTDSFSSAVGAAVKSTGEYIVKANLSANGRERNDDMASVKIRKSDPDPAGEAKVKIAKEAEEACKDCGKSAEDCKCAEATKDDAMKEADAEAKKEDEKEADAEAKMSKEDAAAAVHEHATNIAKLLKDADAEGAGPEDIKELLADIAADFQALCEALGVMATDEPVDEEEMAKDDDDAKKPAPPPPADEEEKDEEDGEDGEEDEPEKKPPMVEKTDLAAAVAKALKPFAKTLAKIEKRLERLDDDTPATRVPSRFNAKETGSEELSTMDQLEAIIKEASNPKDRQVVTQDLVSKLLSDHFAGKHKLLVGK